jgi:hypothetical protein
MTCTTRNIHVGDKAVLVAQSLVGTVTARVAEEDSAHGKAALRVLFEGDLNPRWVDEDECLKVVTIDPSPTTDGFLRPMSPAGPEATLSAEMAPVITVLERMTGTPWRVEHTGGGCFWLRTELAPDLEDAEDGGPALCVTDSDGPLTWSERLSEVGSWALGSYRQWDDDAGPYRDGLSTLDLFAAASDAVVPLLAASATERYVKRVIANGLAGPVIAAIVSGEDDRQMEIADEVVELGQGQKLLPTGQAFEDMFGDRVFPAILARLHDVATALLASMEVK